MKLIGGAAVAAALLVVSGCGGTADGPTAAQKSAAAHKKAEAAAQEKAAQERQQAAADRKAKATAVYNECREVAGPLDKSLTALNSRLSVGLVFEKYSSQVGDAQVVYDAMARAIKNRQGGVSDRCVNRVAIPLQSALSAYVAANSTWNDCNQSDSCTFDKGSPSLTKAQASWAKAGALTTKADNVLTALEP